MFAQANRQKLRLETKQRAARKAAENGVSIEPRWFISRDTPMGEGVAYVSSFRLPVRYMRGLCSLLPRRIRAPCVSVV